MGLLIVSGVSGAGKSQAVKVLEDIGYFCIDNLPPALIPKFLEMCKWSEEKNDKIAVIIDSRGGRIFKDSFQSLNEIEEAGYKYEILFLEANDKVLVKRYKETRRRHPLAPNDRIIVGIEKERQLMESMKKRANYIIDTSKLSVNQLREEILNIFEKGNSFEGLFIEVMSFGFKHGIPNDADMVFDVRFLPNPYYLEDLKPLTGNDKEVQDYVMGFDVSHEFLDKIVEMLDFLIPNYILEGKNQLVVSIGCTGGKHRSVTLANEIYKKFLHNTQGYGIKIEHRDIERDRIRKK